MEGDDGTIALLRAGVAATAERLASMIEAPVDRRTVELGPLVGVVGAADGAPVQLPATGRIADLVDAFGLHRIETGILVAAVASALDARVARLLADMNSAGVHGATTGQFTVDLALAVNGASPWSADDRATLAPMSVLLRSRLITRTSRGGTPLDDTLSVPERVVLHLLGDVEPDPLLVPLLQRPVAVTSTAVDDVARALGAGLWNVWIHDRSGAGASIAATALAELGAPAVTIDLDRLGPEQHLDDVLPLAVREAGLVSGGVVISAVDARRDAHALARLDQQPIRPIVLVSPAAWNPASSSMTPVLVDAPALGPNARAALWSDALARRDVDDPEAAVELSALRLGPAQIDAAVASASAAAIAAGAPVTRAGLRAAALGHGATRLGQLARRLVPSATFDDLVLPDDLVAELRALPSRYANRHVVRETWGLNRSGDGTGVTCLFAGPSGTGKTLAAEVVANSLGVDLFVIDLSQIVDKYIGETEKNLERVFSEAEFVNGVLLFDEADALFGKRSEVRSSHDRHANVEVAYLLQRMERYDGIAVLTTNLRNNLDDAFSRRLDVVCAFVEPDEAARLVLWQQHLPSSLPCADDLDLPLLAEHLEISGGVIRNITLTAAHLAASESRPVTMRDLVVASAREYRKMGRLFSVPVLETLLAVG